MGHHGERQPQKSSRPEKREADGGKEEAAGDREGAKGEGSEKREADGGPYEKEEAAGDREGAKGEGSKEGEGDKKGGPQGDPARDMPTKMLCHRLRPHHPIREGTTTCTPPAREPVQDPRRRPRGTSGRNQGTESLH